MVECHEVWHPNRVLVPIPPQPKDARLPHRLIIPAMAERYSYLSHSFHSESVGVGKIWTSVRNYEERENGDVVIPGEVGLAVL